MLSSFEFHHIGYAVKSIDVTAEYYKSAGYSVSDVICDRKQNVYICWLTKVGSPTIELLAPVNEQSPVWGTLKKNGVSPYHTCYIVDSMEEAIQKLRKMRYVVVSPPVEAPAISNSRVCFLYNREVGLLEIVESPAQIKMK